MIEQQDISAEARAFMRSLYGENKQITDDNYDKSLAVKCINGTFVGKQKDNVIAYKGIPFVGKQPVGELRWKAPVDFVPDEGIYEAYYYGKSPYQADGDPCSLYVMGEDCLYLNVWKAAEPSAGKKPVMVWIYGGGFETGGTVDPQYDCYNFITENPDVIVVTVAYRLAAYGFMRLSHLPDGADYPDAQNLGIMDQMMGLKWVHENIAAFGGDPDNVTIFGESAGGSSCTLISLVKGSHQYFKRVITQSGTPAMTRSKEESIVWTNEVMKELGCKTVADLQKMWANDRMEKKSKLMTNEENALVESYLNSVPGEDWEKTTSLFTQSYFHAPAIRLSEYQTKAGGKAKEWPLYDIENKQVMVLDEFNIHPEKESERKIVDWERTYFLTKLYCN